MDAHPQSGTKPRYLGLLNAISLGESRAGVYLRAWADATCDEDLAATLRFVAARETSHGEVFCRRLCELGYGLRQKPDPESQKRLAKYADPEISDLQKIGRARGDLESDPFSEIEAKLKEGFYDPMTANLLGWYICEERDSAKRLRACYAAVRAKAEGRRPANGMGNGAAKTGNGAAHGVSTDAQAIMACLADGFARIEKKLEEVSA